MLRHPLLWIPILLLVGCKKDDSAPPPNVVVGQPAAKQEVANLPPKDEPKQPEPAKKEAPKPKLVPLDLRAYDLYAIIDLPAGARVEPYRAGEDRHGLEELLVISTDRPVMLIHRSPVDIAGVKAGWKTSGEVAVKTLVVDEPDVLLAEIRQGGETRYLFHRNVTIGGTTYHVQNAFDQTMPLETARQLVDAAKSLRQTPELKKDQEQRDQALGELRKFGAEITDEAPFHRTVTFDKPAPLEEEVFAWLQAVPNIGRLSIRNAEKISANGLASLDRLPRFETLSIEGIGLNSGTVRAIEGMRQLRHLSLSSVLLTDLSIQPIAGLTELRMLGLIDSRISDAGLRHLQNLKNLQFVSLAGTDVAGAGLVHLNECTELTSLDMRDTALNDAGLKGLTALSKLRHLTAADTAITDAGLASLAQLPALQDVLASGRHVTPEGAAQLEKANPNVRAFVTGATDPPFPLVKIPPVALDQLPPADPVALTEKLGGKIARDEEANGKPITGIDLSNTKATDTDLGQLRSLTTLQTLSLEGCPAITDRGLPYLAGLSNLEEMNLRGTQVEGNGLEHLAKLTNLKRLLLPADRSFLGRQLEPLTALPNLEVLTFTVKEPAYPKLQVLTRMTKLKELNLGGVQLNNQKMTFLQNLKDVETLSLGREGVLSDRGLIPLKEMANLKSLVIPNYQGSDKGLDHLKALTQLKALELYGPYITDGGLAAVGYLQNLERLRLDRLNIGDRGLGALRNLGKLIEVSVSRTNVTDRALDVLAESKELESADLSFTKITDAGLAKFKGMEELRGLRLDGTATTGTGFKALEELPRLNRLSLRETKLSAGGLTAIAALSNLRILDLGKTAITNAGVAQLKKLRNLEEIGLSECTQLTDAVVPILKEFYGLKRIAVKGTKLSMQAVEELRKAGVKVE